MQSAVRLASDLLKSMHRNYFDLLMHFNSLSAMFKIQKPSVHIFCAVSLFALSGGKAHADVLVEMAVSNQVTWSVLGSTYSVEGRIFNDGTPSATGTLVSRISIEHGVISAARQNLDSPFEVFTQTGSVSDFETFTSAFVGPGSEAHETTRAVWVPTFGLQSGAATGTNFMFLSAHDNNASIDSIIAFELDTETSSPELLYVIYDSDGDLSSTDIDYNAPINTVADAVLAAVPEPSSAHLLGLFVLVFSLQRRRLKRSTARI